MAVTPPPSVTPAPTPAPQRGDKDTFSTRVDAFVVWLTAAVAQFNAIVTNVYNNAVDAFNNATSAASSASSALTSANNASSSANAAAVTTGATLWSSGQTVNQDQAKISPLDRRTYRRKTATGSGTIDPAIDTANYVLLSADSSSYILVGSATVGSPVANIDFLNLFNAGFNKYVIELIGFSAAQSASLRVQFAVSGSADASASYMIGSNTQTSAGTDIGNLDAIQRSTTIELAGALTQGYRQIGNSIYTSSSIASGFRLFLSSGVAVNFTAGTVKVYGIRN